MGTETHVDVQQLERNRSASGRPNGLASVSELVLPDVEGGHTSRGPGSPPQQRGRTLTDRLHADFLFRRAQSTRVVSFQPSHEHDAAEVELSCMVPHSLFR